MALRGLFPPFFQKKSPGEAFSGALALVFDPQAIDQSGASEGHLRILTLAPCRRWNHRSSDLRVVAD